MLFLTGQAESEPQKASSVCPTLYIARFLPDFGQNIVELDTRVESGARQDGAWIDARLWWLIESQWAMFSSPHSSV